jgi:hypothetical protein
MNNLTNRIKTALLDFYIFQRSAKLACTELWDGFSVADFIVLLKDRVIEIEIKTSLADLYNDVKKGKEYYNYENYEKSNRKLVTKHEIISDGRNLYYTPNKFYFCVPTAMVKDTITFAKTLNTKYGVIEFVTDAKLRDSIKVVKRATNLHNANNISKYSNKMITRLCNDLTKRYRLLYWK